MPKKFDLDKMKTPVLSFQGGREPNNAQFAVAATAWSLVENTKGARKVVVIVPPGLGKSRIATSVIVLSEFTKIVVVYTNEILRANDK